MNLESADMASSDMACVRLQGATLALSPGMVPL